MPSLESRVWTLRRLETLFLLITSDPYVNLARATLLRAIYDLLGRDLRINGGRRGSGFKRKAHEARTAALEWLSGDECEEDLDVVSALAGIDSDHVKEAVRLWETEKFGGLRPGRRAIRMRVS